MRFVQMKSVWDVPGGVMAVKNNLYGYQRGILVMQQLMDALCTDLGLLLGPLYHLTLDVFRQTYKHASNEQPLHTW
jgi:hypothetical protein